jgi:hypothetical protein
MESIAMLNVTTVIETSLVSNEQVIVIACVTNFLMSVFLLVGIVKMYGSIELGHPVYAVLFCDLVSVLMTSIVEMTAIWFLDQIRLIMNAFTYLFIPSRNISIYFNNSNTIKSLKTTTLCPDRFQYQNPKAASIPAWCNAVGAKINHLYSHVS